MFCQNFRYGASIVLKANKWKSSKLLLIFSMDLQCYQRNISEKYFNSFPSKILFSIKDFEKLQLRFPFCTKRLNRSSYYTCLRLIFLINKNRKSFILVKGSLRKVWREEFVPWRLTLWWLIVWLGLKKLRLWCQPQKIIFHF